MRGSLKALTLAMLGAVMAPAGAAEDVIPNHPALNDRFYLAIGAYWPQSTTTAQLDSTRTGTVVTAIQGRDYARVYVKELERGKASFALSPEEAEAVERAMAR